MTRDNQERLAMFAGHDVEVRRIAINLDQVEAYGPPPNPAKDSDSRYAAYVAQYGDDCWELDVLNPTIIDQLIRDELDGIIDHEAWIEAATQEQQNRSRLGVLKAHWDEVETFLNGLA